MDAKRQNVFSTAEGIVMVNLLRVFDPTVVSILLVPVCLVIAAWALRVACSFSSVEPPEFIQSTLTVILIGVANVVVNFFMHVTQASPGIGTHLVVPLLATATMIAVTVKTGPLSALITTVSFASICSGVYYSLSVLNAAMLAKLLA
jgi:uncharacterized membrane protein YwzB